MSHRLRNLLISLVLTASAGAGCTLIAEVDRSKIPDGNDGGNNGDGDGDGDTNGDGDTADTDTGNGGDGGGSVGGGGGVGGEGGAEP